MERARLAEQAEAARVAAETESLRNTLLASISHDLRTPLAVIAGASSTLAEHGRRSRRQLARVAGALDRDQGARDVGARVERARPDALRVRPDRAAPRLGDARRPGRLGAGARRGASARASGRGATFPPTCPPVHVDADLIVQTFANLLDNVAKYTPAGTRGAHRCARRGRVRARHRRRRGPGPAARRIASASVRQVPARQRTKARSSGAGLGLAICRAIVRAHGGDIRARRPAGRRRALRVHAADAGAGRMTQAMHQILVIEDDAAIRNVAARAAAGGALSRRSKRETAARAEIEARSHKPDLLLVDLGLPDGDGLKVIERVRAVVAGADRRAVGAHDGDAEDRRARCRRRRLRDQAVQRAGIARARARGAATQCARQRAAARAADSATIDRRSGAARSASHRRRAAPDAARVSRAGMPGASGRHDRHGEPADPRSLGSGSTRTTRAACACA